MARPDNYKNLHSEKEGLEYLRSVLKGFYIPSTEERKTLLQKLNLPEKYSRSFDVVLLKVASVSEITKPDQVQLLEIKVTKKHLPEFPRKFFFGMTANEEKLLKEHGRLFILCLVSINEVKNRHIFLSYEELKKLIHSKRVQYQISLK